ncbi:hypothetical protein [Nocardia niwae]|uniref:Integrase n=1 Tax=Nocardia niwae TaxID=626084 RepID=A0ABV2XCB4_9NOCA
MDSKRPRLVAEINDPKTIKIEKSVGYLQVWQATAGELDRHLKRLIALSLRRKAKQHKTILRAPKSDNGWRRILLPAHTVEAVRETIKDLEVGDRPNPMRLLFPARNGSLRNPTTSAAPGARRVGRTSRG